MLLTERQKSVRKAWAARNAEKMRAYLRAWRERNREKDKASSLERYYRTDKALIRLRQARWRAANPEKAKAQQHRYSFRHPERNRPRGNFRERMARYCEKHREELRRKKREYQRCRRLDPGQRVLDSIRRRVRHVCGGKARGAITVLGYTAAELRAHLEALFVDGMNWQNYGEWHVDHLRPVSSFDLPAQMAECWALENLQPLWGPENLSKYSKWEFQLCRG